MDGKKQPFSNALKVSVGHPLLLQLRRVITDLLVYLVGLEQKPVAPSPSDGPFPLTSLCFGRRRKCSSMMKDARGWEREHTLGTKQ